MMSAAAAFLPLTPLLVRQSNLSHRCSSRSARIRRPATSKWTAVTKAPAAPSTTPSSIPPSPTDQPSMSPRLVEFLSRAKEGNPLKGLQFADKAFDAWKSGKRSVEPIVFDERHIVDVTEAPPYDVVVAGGTLGIFYACALAARGRRVAVLERGRIAGRSQEWNISREELEALVLENVLSNEDLEAAIVNEFSNGSRIAFPKQGAMEEIFVRGVLDLGVDPSVLVARARARFLELGGAVYEQSTLERVAIRDDSVLLSLRTRDGAVGGDGALGAGGTGLVNESAETTTQAIRARLLIDSMGNFSPIAAQARDGQQPDGCCITVGACLSGDFSGNQQSDLLCSVDGVNQQSDAMYFWEAFPAGRARDRRTTYMFSYGKCDSDRQTLTSALDDYVRIMPEYQGLKLDDVDVERVLFGFFPCYKDSPAQVKFDRVLPVGDAAGSQSPVSFGGFAACMRHLGRISNAVDEALTVSDDSLLTRHELQRLQFYNPSLSTTWLFNSFMQANPELVAKQGRNYINDILLSSMKAMEKLGPNVQKPFLQDVIRAGGLISTLVYMIVRDPALGFRTGLMVSVDELTTFARHLFALVLYTIAAPVMCGLRALLAGVELSEQTRYKLNRFVDQLQYGAGLD